MRRASLASSRRRERWSWALVVALAAGCPGPASRGLDAGPGDAGTPDAGTMDAGWTDAGLGDAGTTDAGLGDAGLGDAGAADAGDCIPQPGVSPAGLPDAGPPVDSGVPFLCPPDAGATSDVDAVIAAMAPGSWKELPCTQMAQVCPQPYDHYLCGAVMDAWSGGAFDPVADRLIVAGGGHSDSYYNDVFGFDLGTASWRRWTELPNGMDGQSAAPVFSDKRVEDCGLYPRAASLCIPNEWLTPTGYLDPARCDDPAITPQLDPQQPRSRHTYGNVAFSPATGRFYLLGGGALFPSGQTGTARVDGFDFDAGVWIRSADNVDDFYGTSATDGQGRIWYLGAHDLSRYDPIADAWTVWPGEGQDFNSGAVYGYYASADVDTTRDVLVVTSDGQQLETYQLADGGLTTVAATGLAAPLPSEAGMAYDPAIDRFVWWNGGQQLYFLNPATWAWTRVQGQGDLPGPPASNGTFGRFRYSPRRNVFVAVSTTETNVFLFKPPAAAP